MAGNIVKWWKHKILGGYKQFTVQECSTDSEELIYHQLRAPSSCSAPPDLLLMSEREGNKLSIHSPVVNIFATARTTKSAHNDDIPTTATTTTTTNTSDILKSYETPPPMKKIHAHKIKKEMNKNFIIKQQQQQQQHQHQQQTIINQHRQQQPQQQQNVHHKHHNPIHGNYNFIQQQQQKQQLENNENIQTRQQQQHNNNNNNNNNNNQQQQQFINNGENCLKNDGKRLDFTCDVSVESSKTTQPLQFSFTFYDVDGHHGKITKDDIVGIVYTIYESIGKSVIVPHSGSKTINVRLIVSPDMKMKRDVQPAAMSKTSTQNEHVKGLPYVMKSNARRTHRHRPCKLVISDDENDDSNSERKRNTGVKMAKNHSISKYNKLHKLEAKDEKLDSSAGICNFANLTPAKTENEEYTRPSSINLTTASSPLQVTSTSTRKKTAITPNEAYLRQASARVKMLRKARKQKYQDYCYEIRQRSLSMDNAPHSSSVLSKRHISEAASKSHVNDNDNERLTIKTKKSPHCQKTTLNRNELISIIRESMEKNRLCFQLNGKPQANVSPLRQSSLCLDSQPSVQSVFTISEPNTSNHMNVDYLPSHYASVGHHYNNSNNNDNNNNIENHNHHHHHHHSRQQQQQQQQQQRSATVSKIPTLIVNHNSTNPPTTITTTTATTIASPLNPTETTTTTANNNNNNYLKLANDSKRNSNNLINKHKKIQQQQKPPLVIQQNMNIEENNHNNNNDDDNKSESTNSSHYHPQPHIPIYHQQMPMNPVILAAAKQNSLASHNKINLCGYDSYLHAAYCQHGDANNQNQNQNQNNKSMSNNNVKSPTKIRAVAAALLKSSQNNHIYNNSQLLQQQQQPIAAVQPLLLTSTPINSPQHSMSNNNHNSSNKLIKTHKIGERSRIMCNNNSYARMQHQQQQQHQHHTHKQQQFINQHNHNHSNTNNNRNCKIKHDEAGGHKKSINCNRYQRLSSSSSSATLMRKHEMQQQQQQTLSNYGNEENNNNNNNFLLDRVKKQNLSTMTPTSHQKDAKNYNNMLFARLQEKLHISGGGGGGSHRKGKENNLAFQQQEPRYGVYHSNQRSRAKHHLIDSMQCDRLICQTSDDEHDDNDDDASIVVVQQPSTNDHKCCTTTSTTTTTTAEINDNNGQHEHLISLDHDIETNQNVIKNVDVGDIGEQVGTTTKVNYDEAIDDDDDDDDDEEEAQCYEDIHRFSGIDDMETLMPKPSTSKNSSYNLNNSRNKLIIAEAADLRTSISSTSSLIHRYVHEHIHHHYHHFKDQPIDSDDGHQQI